MAENASAVLYVAAVRRVHQFGWSCACSARKVDDTWHIPGSKSDRPLTGNWRYGGQPAAVSGGIPNLVFKNEHGALSNGRFIDDVTVVASDWNNLRGRRLDGGSVILWENGTWWQAQ